MPRYTFITSSHQASNTSFRGADEQSVTCDVNSCAPPEGTDYSVLPPSDRLEVLQGEQRVAVTLLDMGPPVLLTIDGKPYEVTVDDFGEYNVVGSGHHFRVGTLGTATRVAAAIADGVYAPMPGRIVKVLCRVGDVVERGAAVVVLEAMKMENELAAPARGRVTEVLTTEGNAVEARTKLVTLAEA